MGLVPSESPYSNDFSYPGWVNDFQNIDVTRGIFVGGYLNICARITFLLKLLNY